MTIRVRNQDLKNLYSFKQEQESYLRIISVIASLLLIIVTFQSLFLYLFILTPKYQSALSCRKELFLRISVLPSLSGIRLNLEIWLSSDCGVS